MERIIGNYTSQANRSFPLDCETLEAIQNNIDMLASLGNMVGDKTILSGCQPRNGGGRDEGYVFLKTTSYPLGEVLHFLGSNEDSDYLHLSTSNGDVTQGNITYTGAYTTRQVLQGTGEEQWAWEELSAPMDIEAIAASLRSQMSDLMDEVERIKPVPLGVVEMYSGSTIPENYGVCDGQALSKDLYADLYQVIGTRFNKVDTASNMFCLPDLRGRFIVGQGSDADYNTIGNTGGEKKHLLTADESGLPAHGHSASTGSAGAHTHTVGIQTGHDGVSHGGGGDTIFGGTVQTSKAPSHTHSVIVQNNQAKDAAVSHENRPPYFVLFYIMRLK
jgi:microcystin-dependent protein